ncbi:MAG TPA: porin [Sphingomicrobium sp.]|jgi:phosphate-selective porin OprO/OprP
MIRKTMIAALLAGSALGAAPAVAQEQLPEAQQEPTEPDTSDATADAAIAGAAPVDDAQAKIELLEAQVEALSEALEGIKTQMTATAPTWKGAPLYEDKEAGWSFKPRGRIQYDAGYIGNPDDEPNGSLITRNLGFNTRARRIRLGAEGTIPGGFGYKFEMDYANSSVGFGDVVLTYAPKDKPFNFIIGNHETWNGLEQISSSRFLSFMERAAFDDAFVNTRRIGLSAGYVNKAGDLRLNAGLFAAHSIDSSLDNDGWIGAARAVYSPLSGANQLHFGANFQHREFQSNNGGTIPSSVGQPSAGQSVRYRARPFSQLTDVRFVDTGNFAAKGDNIIGLEAAGIFKSLHVAAEGQYTKVDAYGGGDTFNVDDTLDLFGTTAGTPTSSFYVADGNPSFWGGYIEAGYYLTGETRGYKAGTWDRTKVLKPFSKGGWGAVQINGRVDYLDLDSGKLKRGCTNNFTAVVPTCTGTAVAPGSFANYTKGGKQLGLLASLVWIPEDYFRMYLQYSHASITGGPFADEVDNLSGVLEADDIDKQKYGVDVIMTRAQIDF